MAENLTTETSPACAHMRRSYFFLLFGCIFAAVVDLSCVSKPTDMRLLVPAETLVYMETNDLGAALQPIVESKAFDQAARSKPDLSGLKGVQLAVAITGFETSEEKLEDEHSVARIQPHFVAVADTHAWHFQAVGFAEQKLGSFAAEIYDSEPTLEKLEKNGGRYFTWTAKDGRKAYAFVLGSIIYFTNDGSAIDKCLAVKRGEADSMVKGGKVPPADPSRLASGYVSTDGVAQIANVAGLKLASESGVESEVQSAVATLLPHLLRSSVTDVTWTAAKNDLGIEDKWTVSTPPELARVLSETLAPGLSTDYTALEYLPADAASVSLYNLKDPQVAWRSVLLSAEKQTDPLAGKIIATSSTAFFEPYGVRDPEGFLNAAGPNIVTAKLDDEGDKPIVIAHVRDAGKIRSSLLPELKLDKQITEAVGVEFWSDGDLAAAFAGDLVIAGDSDSVRKCLESKRSGPMFAASDAAKQIIGNKASSVTVSRDLETAAGVADLMSVKRSDDVKAASRTASEMRFKRYGIERRTVSDLGLIGYIIAQLSGG